jgi:hypothetical protein
VGQLYFIHIVSGKRLFLKRSPTISRKYKISGHIITVKWGQKF